MPRLYIEIVVVSRAAVGLGILGLGDTQLTKKKVVLAKASHNLGVDWGVLYFAAL